MSSKLILPPPATNLINQRLSADGLNSVFDFLNISDRRLAASVVCKTWNQALQEDPKALTEDRVNILFKHGTQKWIVKAFGSGMLSGLTVIPFDMNYPQQGFNRMGQLSTRIAIGRTNDDNYSQYGLMLTFQTYQTATSFVECLFDIDFSAPLNLDAPLAQPSEQEKVQKKENKLKAIAEVIDLQQQPIAPSQEEAGFLFMKNKFCFCFASVNNTQ